MGVVNSVLRIGYNSPGEISRNIFRKRASKQLAYLLNTCMGGKLSTGRKTP